MPGTRIESEPYRGISGVEVYRVHHAAPGLRVEVSDAAPAVSPSEREQTERAWSAMCAGNPRLYSGDRKSVV